MRLKTVSMLGWKPKNHQGSGYYLSFLFKSFICLSYENQTTLTHPNNNICTNEHRKKWITKTSNTRVLVSFVVFVSLHYSMFFSFRFSFSCLLATLICSPQFWCSQLVIYADDGKVTSLAVNTFNFFFLFQDFCFQPN